LKPSTDVTDNGPQMSMWTRSKQLSKICELMEKGSIFCLAWKRDITNSQWIEDLATLALEKLYLF